MNIGAFVLVLLTGVALVAAQGALSWVDGFLTQSQMRARGMTNGWSFLEHGGIWADLLLVSPVVAYVIANYRLAYFSQSGLLMLGGTISLAVIMGRRYVQTGITVPEAHTHSGRTTPAGWLHGVYAVL